VSGKPADTRCSLSRIFGGFHIRSGCVGELKGFVFFANRVLYVCVFVTLSSYLYETTGEDVFLYDFPVIITDHNLRKLSLLYSEGFRCFSNQQKAGCGRTHQLSLLPSHKTGTLGIKSYSETDSC